MDILRLIMSTGGGIVVILGINYFVCPSIFPVTLDQCLPATIDVINVLRQHFVLVEVTAGAVGGGAVYHLLGRWINN